MTVRRICAAALGCGVLAVLCVTAPVPGVVRTVAVLAFCCWVPGVALFAALRAWSLVSSPAATVATSLSLLVLISQIAVALHWWQPAAGTGVLGVACVLALAPAVFAPRLAGAPA